MALASLVCWALVALLTGGEARAAVLLGVLGPFAAAAGTWVLVERTYRRTPERMSRLMVVLFGAKLVLIGAFVAVVIVMLSQGAALFVVSFTAQYVTLHAIEALCLRRLFSRGPAALGR
jgi:hypothetical protein